MFDCETLPSSPGLRTRIETLVLLGSICVALDAAPACCDVVADWPDTWMFPGSAAATAARARHKAVVSTSARINFLITPPNSWTELRRLPQPNVGTSRELAGTGAPVVAQSATARQRGRKDAAQQSEDEERQRAGQRDRQHRRTAAVSGRSERAGGRRARRRNGARGRSAGRQRRPEPCAVRVFARAARARTGCVSVDDDPREGGRLDRTIVRLCTTLCRAGRAMAAVAGGPACASRPLARRGRRPWLGAGEVVGHARRRHDARELPLHVDGRRRRDRRHREDRQRRHRRRERGRQRRQRRLRRPRSAAVPAELAALALEAARFDCVTSPSFPGLAIRIDNATLHWTQTDGTAAVGAGASAGAVPLPVPDPDRRLRRVAAGNAERWTDRSSNSSSRSRHPAESPQPVLRCVRCNTRRIITGSITTGISGDGPGGRSVGRRRRTRGSRGCLRCSRQSCRASGGADGRHDRRCGRRGRRRLRADRAARPAILPVVSLLKPRFGPIPAPPERRPEPQRRRWGAAARPARA